MEHHPPQRPQNPLANYQFSSDEIRVLRECNTESFFQRSLPLGTSFGVGAYLAVKNGYLKANIKYGAVPKVIVGVVIGYFMGKFSYQQKCAEKLMKLPNSRLGEVLRQRKQGGIMGSLTPDQNIGFGLALAPFSNVTDVYSDEKAKENARSGALNLDVESRPTISGLDDMYRPSLDTPSQYLESEIPIEPVKPGTTYEELRNRNRQEYNKKQQNTFSRPLPPEAQLVIRQPQQTPSTKLGEDTEIPIRSGKRNIYGDTWTD